MEKDGEAGGDMERDGGKREKGGEITLGTWGMPSKYLLDE